MRTLKVLFFLVLFAAGIRGQSNWDTYADRGISELVQQEQVLIKQTPKVDIIISAQPFPSKTVVTFTGSKRPMDALTKDFVKVWAQSRNLPAENADQLVEEYLFREKKSEYWIPVLKSLAPFFEKELKSGDEIMIYYFYLGGFNPRSLYDKSTLKPTISGALSDNIRWIFAVEEFQKPRSSEFVLRSLESAIDRSLEEPGKISGVWLDPRQMKSKTKVTFTGESRDVSGYRVTLRDLWFEKNGFAGSASSLMSKEVRFVDNGKEYWIPIRNTMLGEITQKFKKGDTIYINSILVGGINTGGKVDWLFLAGAYSID